MQDFPYWRLSGFYFFYFALLGASIPYWGLYLKSLGFSSSEIGLLGGVIMATKVVAPSIWGWIADRRSRRLPIIRIGSFLAMAAFAGIYLSSGLWWVAFVVAAYSFFWNAVLPQFEVLTLAKLGQQYNRYSQVRVWGSIGFIIAVAVLGLYLDVFPIDHLPGVMLLFLAGIWVCSLSLTETPRTIHHADGQKLLPLVLRGPVVAFLLACCLLQIAHGPYYTFLSLFLEELGYQRVVIGQLWALGVLAEVVLFLFMHRILPRFGVRQIMLWSLLIAAVRWLLIGYGAQSLPVLLVAQLMHAATFGAFHAASIEMIRRTFPARLAGQGQALYSGISFGAGGAIGAVLSGLLWDVNHQLTFVMATVASILAFLISWRWIHDTPNNHASDNDTPTDASGGMMSKA